MSRSVCACPVGSVVISFTNFLCREFSSLHCLLLCIECFARIRQEKWRTWVQTSVTIVRVSQCLDFVSVQEDVELLTWTAGNNDVDNFTLVHYYKLCEGRSQFSWSSINDKTFQTQLSFSTGLSKQHCLQTISRFNKKTVVQGRA